MNLLFPNKIMNPDLTVLATASFLLKRIQKVKIESYMDLYAALKAKNKNAIALFIPSLEFLFLLDLIKYHQKNDIIEYIGK